MTKKEDNFQANNGELKEAKQAQLKAAIEYHSRGNNNFNDTLLCHNFTYDYDNARRGERVEGIINGVSMGVITLFIAAAAIYSAYQAYNGFTNESPKEEKTALVSHSKSDIHPTWLTFFSCLIAFPAAWAGLETRYHFRYAGKMGKIQTSKSRVNEG